MARPPLQIGSHGSIRTYGWIDGRWAPKDSLSEGVRPDTWRAITNYRHRDGKTRPLERSGPTEQKARTRLRKALRELTDDPARVRLTKASRFKDLSEPWLAHVAARRSKTTVDTYRRNLDNVIKDRLGNLQLPELSVATLEEFFDDLHEEGLSANYRRGIRTVVRGHLSFALRRGLIASNPIREVSPIEGAPKKVRSLTAAERVGLLAQLDDLAATDQYFKHSALPHIVRLMLGTGVRIGEAVAIRWHDLNLTDSAITVNGTTIPPRTAHINGNIVYITGEGLYRHDGKTENANRMIALPEFLVTLLLVLRDVDSIDEEPVFPSRTLGWRYPNNVRRGLRDALAKIKERSGEDYTWITSHVFRKTAATILDDDKQSPRQIADQLGHAKPSMTQDVYMGRGTANPAAAAALDAAYSQSEK